MHAQISATQAIGSSFATQASNWKGIDTNYQQEFNSYSNFSFQTSTRATSLQTSSFHPSSIEFMPSVSYFNISNFLINFEYGMMIGHLIKHYN